MLVNYTGMSAEEMEGRMTSVYERVLTTLVNNIEHVESAAVNGLAAVKIYLQLDDLPLVQSRTTR